MSEEKLIVVIYIVNYKTFDKKIYLLTDLGGWKSKLIYSKCSFHNIYSYPPPIFAYENYAAFHLNQLIEYIIVSVTNFQIIITVLKLLSVQMTMMVRKSSIFFNDKEPQYFSYLHCCPFTQIGTHQTMVVQV